MPSKHIDEMTWRKVEKETLRAIKEVEIYFKETDVLKMLILKGLETIEDEDYIEMGKKKKK